jgi:hypothetical protein
MQSCNFLLPRLFGPLPSFDLFWVDLNLAFVIVYQCRSEAVDYFYSGGPVMATKSNFILKVQDAKLADVQKALKDANINVVSILEVHKEEV